MGKTGKLTPRQTEVINALLTAPTTREAAESAGVPAATVYNWASGNETFRRALREAQNRALTITVARLAGAAPRAADVLAEIAEDEEISPGIRVQAASKLLSEARQSFAAVEFVQRVERLEEVIHELRKQTGPT